MMTMGDLPKLDLQLQLWATVCNQSSLYHCSSLCIVFSFLCSCGRISYSRYDFGQFKQKGFKIFVFVKIYLRKWFFVFCFHPCTLYIVFSSACLLWHKAPIKFPQQNRSCHEWLFYMGGYLLHGGELPGRYLLSVVCEGVTCKWAWVGTWGGSCRCLLLNIGYLHLLRFVLPGPPFIATIRGCSYIM